MNKWYTQPPLYLSVTLIYNVVENWYPLSIQGGQANVSAQQNDQSNNKKQNKPKIA